MKKFSIFNSHFSLPSGFTLIEILIAVAIVGILASATLAAINPLEQIKKSNDARRKADLTEIQKALDMYYQDQGRYPASSGDYKISVNNQIIEWGSKWAAGNGQPYMVKVPADPVGGKSYIYFSPPGSNGQTYYLYANLERGDKDPQACNNGNACSSFSTGGQGFPPGTACSPVCNFGVSSTNVSP